MKRFEGNGQLLLDELAGMNYDLCRNTKKRCQTAEVVSGAAKVFHTFFGSFTCKTNKKPCMHTMDPNPN
jgi:hypothetical protein